MKVNVNYARKAGRENYGSEGFSLSIESEPPPEVAQDLGKLRVYVEALFSEVKARVEDQVVVGERDSAPAPVRSEPRLSRGASTSGRGAPARVERGPTPSNGRTDGRNDNGLASPKQVNFLRSLGSQNGLSYGQLSALAEETYGKRDLRDLSKKDASGLIDQLRSEAA